MLGSTIKTMDSVLQDARFNHQNNGLYCLNPKTENLNLEEEALFLHK
jgi:hypothetical protein